MQNAKVQFKIKNLGLDFWLLTFELIYGRRNYKKY